MYTKSSLLTNIALLTLGAIFATAIIFGSLLLRARENAVLGEADAKIMTAALALEQILSPQYHDRIVDSNSVTSAQFEALVDSNNQLCRQDGLQYVWSVLALGSNQLVFTSATSPDHTTSNHQHARFFEAHREPQAFAGALNTLQPSFSTFRNQWGQGRMVLLPKHDRHGRVYILAASVALDKMDGLLQRAMVEALGVATLLALLAGLLLTQLLRKLLRPLAGLSQAAHRLALGDFETSLGASGSREAKLLAESLETMRLAVRQQMDALRRSAERVGHVNDLLRSIQNVDRLILKEGDAVRLLQATCESLVQVRGYRLVWIGQPEAGSHRVVPVASAGSGVAALVCAPITWDESPTGRGPTGTAIRERRTVVVDDLRTDPNCAPWQSTFETCGVCSLASAPLQAGDDLFGAITLAADKPQAFDAEESALLGTLAQNLAHALKALADAAALRHTRQALDERERQYQTMLTSTLDGFISIDMEGRILDCNSASCQLFGFSQAELLQRSLTDLVDEETRGKIPARIAAIAAQGGTRFESHMLHRAGRSIDVEVSAHHLPHLGGRVYAFLRDITANKQAELAQLRYQLILQYARDAILLVKPDGQIIEGNATAQTLYGYTREELLKLNIYALRPHEAPAVVQSHMAAVRASGILFEALHRRKDGSLVPVEVSAQGVQIAGEEMLLSLIRDISMRKQADAALLASEQRLTQLATVTGEFIWEVDQAGVYTFTSTACEALLGYAPEDLVGKLHFYDLFPEAQRAKVRQQAFAVMAQQKKFRDFPNQVQTRQGQVLEMLTSGAPRLDAQGVCVGYYGSDRDVTAQKQAEAALQQLAERLNLATHAAHLGVWDLDVQQNHLYWDEEMYVLYGRRAADFQPTYADWRAALHPEDNERSHAILQEALAKRTEYQSEFRIIRPDGEVRNIQAHAHIVRDAAGRALRIIGLNIDITELKQTETALRESKENFRQLVEELNDAIFEIDINAVISYASPVFKNLFGHEPAALVGQPFTAFVLPEDRPLVAATIEDVLRGNIVPGEFRMQALDGSLHWVRVSTRPAQKAGRTYGLRGVMIDITEAKRAQAALWASEERFRALVEKALDCFIIINASGIITYISPAIQQMTGRAPETYTGRHFAEHMHNESRIETGQALECLLQHPELPIRLVARFKHQDGTWRTLEGVATNLLEHSAVQGILINCQDITSRDMLARQLRQAQKMEAIGTLAGGIAHDFNNMLFAIMGFTSMALKRAKKDKTLSEDLGQIMTASQRSAELVRQLLIFSRQAEKSRVEVAVTPMLKETYRLLRATLPTSIDIRLDLQATHDVVSADPVQVQQIVMNLSTNAFFAMREKGGLLTLRLEELAQTTHPEALEAPHGWLCLSVSDTGCGIPAAHMDRLFEPFFTTKAIGEGTGLGLPVVHGIVTAAGGFIDVVSAPGEGATFKIYLPLLKSAAHLPEPGATDLTPAPAKAYRILCVDDEKVLTSMIQRTLTAQGYQVTAFNDSPAALAELRLQPQGYDVLLTDQTMPQLTGLDLIRAARQVRPDLPCILLTGYDSELVSAAQCRELGTFLRHKPLTHEELGNVIHVALRQQPGEETT